MKPLKVSHNIRDVSSGDWMNFRRMYCAIPSLSRKGVIDKGTLRLRSLPQDPSGVDGHSKLPVSGLTW